MNLDNTAKVSESTGFNRFLDSPILHTLLGLKPLTNKAAPREEPTQKQESNKKDPQFTNVGPKNTQNVKVNDTEADVLAKLYNMMFRKYERDRIHNEELKKRHKDRDLENEQRKEDIIAALLGDEAVDVSKHKGRKSKVGQKIKTENTKKKTGLLKFGAMGLVGVGGMLATDKALASIGEIKLPKFDINDVLSKLPDIGVLEKTEEKQPQPELSIKPSVEWKKDIKFLENVQSYSKEMNIDPTDLLGVMAAESGIDPKAKNKGSGATGLIQFMPSTAKGLGTTTEELSKMDRSQQFEYVKKYFTSVGLKKGAAKEDIYAKVFLPARSESEVLAKKGESYYEANVGLDIGKKGYIAKTDLSSFVEKRKKQFDITSASIPSYDVSGRKTAMSDPRAISYQQSITENTFIESMNKKWSETIQILDSLEESVKKMSFTQLNSVTNNSTITAVQQPKVNDEPALIQQQYQ
jgi:hypothetical protein